MIDDRTTDLEAAALIREIKSRDGWQEGELLQRAIEILERYRERVESLKAINVECRRIIDERLGRLPKVPPDA